MGRHDADEKFLTSGLNPALSDRDDIIMSAAWDRAADEKSIVGTCRALDQAKRPCTGYLKARERYEASGVWWYEAECMRCGVIVAAANGKTLTRSSRRSEMPAGVWEQRIKAITKAFSKTEAP